MWFGATCVAQANCSCVVRFPLCAAKGSSAGDRRLEDRRGAGRVDRHRLLARQQKPLAPGRIAITAPGGDWKYHWDLGAPVSTTVVERD